MPAVGELGLLQAELMPRDLSMRLMLAALLAAATRGLAATCWLRFDALCGDRRTAHRWAQQRRGAVTHLRSTASMPLETGSMDLTAPIDNGCVHACSVALHNTMVRSGK